MGVRKGKQLFRQKDKKDVTISSMPREDSGWNRQATRVPWAVSDFLQG